MLSSRHRLRTSDDIRTTMRRGRRAGSRTVLAHVRFGARSPQEPVRVAFVVGKQVGDAVTRNTVKRRLRGVVAARLADIPGGTDLVLRALPASARKSSAELGSDVDKAFGRLSGASASSTPVAPS
ncbi:ribonuclease P protein component [Mumia sp. zg.B17]|uniref:ribonuclease P protein component n=1 Tax=unclassified Mumia TaxID=2621872 RepID=UPI001C6F53FE|nr:MULTISPECIES: ribonuclease P protein component [unclassified Mumia]MBW9207723.1 ribonuclease P protein component [Mumia sp. zg.B17]MBW9209931.1 ribonuclease P protein component [Mumia sp. zg.B21]MDD9347656.1 ribonuclease P protein component [Mumia sp.]